MAIAEVGKWKNRNRSLSVFLLLDVIWQCTSGADADAADAARH